MEKIRFYDEAVFNFYRGKELGNYPITSLDFYTQHFSRICKNLMDIKNLSDLAKKENWKHDTFFNNEILEKNHVVVVTDIDLNIVYASQNIHLMNGYLPHEIIGKKPKIFQGKDTCIYTTQKVAQAIIQNKTFEVVLKNYRKNGTPYNCWIKGSPVLDKMGKVVNFIAFEKEVA